MNYQIIQDEEILKEFIDFLPNLEKNEIYYVALFARKKYDEVLKSDKSQLKRFTATKDRLLIKIKQLEIEVGRYQSDGIEVSQKSLALYIMPNPRSLQKASLELLESIVNDINNGRVHNPNSESLSAIQKSCARKLFCDVDIDLEDKSKIPTIIEDIEKNINPNCLTLIETRGGLHVLVETSKVEKQYSKSWYMNIVNKYADPTRSKPMDNLIPIPGCIQGLFVPKILKQE
jgi:hypothetical protein